VHDQADYLRRLVKQRQAVLAHEPSGPAPRLLSVVGAKGGVGATTVAVNLAVALSQFGQRVVLVDADLRGPNVDTLCQLDDGDSLVEVLAGQRSVHEVLRRGPAGVQVLPGKWSAGEPVECSPAAQERLIEELRGLGSHADVVILDVGSGVCPRVRRFLAASQAMALVTTPDNVAVMDAYASIKVLASESSPWVGTLVNFALSGEQAADAAGRIALCCRRFLGREIDDAGWVPVDPAVKVSGNEGKPHVVALPDCSATRAMQRMAAHVVSTVLSEPAAVAVG